MPNITIIQYLAFALLLILSIVVIIKLFKKPAPIFIKIGNDIIHIKSITQIVKDPCTSIYTIIYLTYDIQKDDFIGKRKSVDRLSKDYGERKKSIEILSQIERATNYKF